MNKGRYNMTHKKIKFPIWMTFHKKIYEIEHDEYLRKEYNRLYDDITQSVLPFEQKLMKMVSLKTDRTYLSCFINSVVINILHRTGVIIQNKETYLMQMGKLYDMYHSSIAQDDKHD